MAAYGSPQSRVGVATVRAIFGIIGIGAMVLGWIGFSRYLTHGGATAAHPLDIAYYDLQLFVLGAEPFQNGGLHPWQLELARFMAPLFTLLTIVEATRLLLANELRRLRARRSHGHVVVCGDSAFAAALAEQLIDAGEKVVAIRIGAVGYLEPRHRRLLTVSGNARSVAVLRDAGLARARLVYVCAGDDDYNHAVSVAASRLLQHVDRPPWVYVEVTDLDMCQALQARRLSAASSNRLRLDYFHIDDVAARRLYQIHPLTGGGTPTRILIAGDDPMRRCLLVETVRHWHDEHKLARGELHIDLVGVDATIGLAKVHARYPFLDNRARMSVHDVPVRTFITGLPDARYDRVYLCTADDLDGLELALTVPPLWYATADAVVVMVREQTSLAEAFHGLPTTDLLDEVSGKVRLYPVFSHACDAQLISYDLTERLAQNIHAEYLRGLAHLPAGAVQPRARPSWQQLPNDLRAANRAQVQDLAAKMLTVGWVVAPRRGLGADVITADQVDQLAQAEHERWCAERRGQRWNYGPVRDDDRKVHPDLVSWNDLSHGSREKNRRAIRRLPDILGEAGFEIVSLNPAGQPGIHSTNRRLSGVDGPVRVAITGHTDLTVETAEAIYRDLVGYLDGLGSTAVTGLTCLAEGADQLFARAVLAAGGGLEVILPAPDYREQVLRREQQQTFDALLIRADSVTFASMTTSGRDAYSAANRKLLQRADCLVAVWDGNPDDSIGGTAVTVRQATEQGMPVTVLWPSGSRRTGAAST